jgi:DNA-binding CsgD family transcriptional regulator
MHEWVHKPVDGGMFGPLPLVGSTPDEGVAGMTRTVGDRMVESAGRGWVGREREFGALVAAAAAEEPPFLVAFVHGPGGIGKSHLVRRLLDNLPAPARGVYLDGRDVEPTPRGLRGALGRALKLPQADPDVAALARALAPRPAVLVIDTYEVLGLLDAWLRTQFLPALPATTLTVLAGRDRPAIAWHTTAGWQGLVAEFPLTALSEQEAGQLLRLRGLDGRPARWAGEFAHGHPLALELAAAAVRADPKCAYAASVASVGLLEAFLGKLPAETVTLVEAASTVRRITEPILDALLDRSSGRGAFDVLRALPFTEQTGEGLLLHDVVRDTVGHDLSMRDPDRRRAYRRRAVRHLTEHQHDATADPWLHTADLMFLIENPVLRDSCFPSARPDHCVEPAAPRDRATVSDIVARHESSAAATLLERWWDCHSETFSVARDPDGVAAAFVQIAELDKLDPQLLADDPVAGVWRSHLRDHLPAADDRVLVMRRWLGRESGELRSPAVSACWLDVKRVYMQLRPRLRRIYSVVVDLPRLAPIFLPLGFAPTGDPVMIDGTAHQAIWLDFGPGSVDGWLAGLIGAETAQPATSPHGSVIGLSSRELEVLRLVADGRSNREIGELLFISEKTAGRHLSNIFVKLDVHSRAEAARIAAEQGLTR